MTLSGAFSSQMTMWFTLRSSCVWHLSGLGDGGGLGLRDFARSPGSPCPQCHEPGAPEDLFSFSIGFALLCPKSFSCYLHLANICPLFMAALGRRLSRRLTALAPSDRVNHHPLCITALSFARFWSCVSHSDALMSRMLLPPPWGLPAAGGGLTALGSPVLTGSLGLELGRYEIIQREESGQHQSPGFQCPVVV